MTRPAILGVAMVLLAWLGITELGVIQRLFLPSPLQVATAFADRGFAVGVLFDCWSTLWRTLVGVLLGTIPGVAVGLAMGRSRIVHDTMQLPVDFFRSIPATALFPLFIVIWGLGDRVKIFIAAWAAGMAVLINTVYGARSASRLRLMVARTKKLSWGVVLTRIVIPGALPFVLAGLRIGLSLALVVEIVAEMFLGSHSGLGHRIFNATSILEMEEAYGSVFVVGILGYGLNRCVLAAERALVHWQGR